MRDLVAMLAPASERPTVHLVYGTVTQSSPLLVQVGASTVGTSSKRLSSYTPVLNDYVAVLVAEGDRVVLGKVS